MRRDVTVTVADSYVGELDDLVRRLALAGMQVRQVLPTLGVITGSVDDSGLAALEALPGVAAVEQQASVQLPPPDADVQ
jgi:hypothetical protein